MQISYVLAVVLGLLAVVVVGWLVTRGSSQRVSHLKRRFGPEYDRVLKHHEGDSSKAEAELKAREQRLAGHRIRPLDSTERARFEREWDHLQTLFVDTPAGALKGAEDLLEEVMHVTGYPDSQAGEQRAADLSVRHAGVVHHYRSARLLTTPAGDEPVHTEDYRQAVVHYRALLDDLLQPGEAHAMQPREAHV